MNKRIIISESEKKRILSQHKQTIKNESDLKKQSLSERELSNLVGKVLIKEQLEQIPGLPEGMPEGMGDCLSKISVIKDNTKMQIKIAKSCMSFDVETCSKAIMEVGVELGTKVLTNPTILVNFGKDVIEFAKCMSEKFEMDPMDLPIENLTSSNTTEMKEGASTECKPSCKFPQKCINGKCETTTSTKQMEEETDEVIYEIEFNEESYTEMDEDTDARNCCRRGCRGTSEICQNCRCVPRHDWGK